MSDRLLGPQGGRVARASTGPRFGMTDRSLLTFPLPSLQFAGGVAQQRWDQQPGSLPLVADVAGGKRSLSW